MGDVTDCCEQCGVDHGCSGTQQNNGGKPGSEVIPDGDHAQRQGLDEHAADDQWFASDPVREGTGDQLPGAQTAG
ncbi:hypothetical protein AHiyo4_10480 [Arthrobacter sp. Hiyo4]|nr:hypothetical protein AHiyo4_10480 [Arthrobacter sp. Hiyo4]